MLIAPNPGIMLGYPQLTPQPVWQLGYNVRFRLAMMETLGLFGPVKTVTDEALILPAPTSPYRRLFTTPSQLAGQILAGAVDRLTLIDFDPAATPIQGTRYRSTDITPAGLPAATDIVTVPSAGRVEIPPVWWFSDQDDLVVGSRANLATEGVYAWDRNPVNLPMLLANAPTGAVGGGIINRILVLLGCTSFTDPDPKRFMTIRWSDRFNFENWTPSDVTISGEIPLEGGSRIVGGGVTGFGVVAWTDKRMALLRETFDPDSVFDRKYIDGGRGLLANNAWCEADGQVWWYDETRTLNVFDGGRPRQIPNPLKYATIERIDDARAARAYLTPNPEYGEIILHYPDLDTENPDTQLVFNYLYNAWSIWRLNRTGWHARVGVIPPIAIDPANRCTFHDLDTSLPDAYINGPALEVPTGPLGAPALNSDYLAALNDILLPPASRRVPEADVDPYSFMAATNPITMEEVTSQSWRATRMHINHHRAPAEGAEDDFSAQLTGYGLAQVENSPLVTDARIFAPGQMAEDFRVGGKALQISLFASDIKTVFRFANMTITEAGSGAR